MRALVAILMLILGSLSNKVLSAEAKYRLDISEQELATAFNELHQQTGVLSFFPYELVEGKKSNRIKGRFTLPDALALMLKNTGLSGVLSNERVITISASAEKSPITSEEELMSLRNMKKTGVAAAFAAMVSGGGAVNAQDSDQNIVNITELEEITVVGIRSSIVSATARKRDSDVIRDSIVSEDIGRFPDSNVAESLQRIPGVAIDRTSGEGQRVTVRGFGPDFNTVLINGRRTASSSIAGVGGAADDNIGASLSNRGFNFDVIAADLVGGLDVYKTASVALQDGGIGSTINLRTVRPLDLSEDKYLFSIKGTYNDVGGDTSPSVFGFVGKKFLDDRLGFIGSVSYQDRSLRRETIAENGFIPTLVTPGQTTGIGPGVGGAAGLFYVPQQVALTANEQERERLGLTTALQYKASDAVTVTLDAIYTELDVDSDVDSLANFYFINGSNLSEVTLDANNTFTSFNNTDRQIAYNGRAYTRPSSLLSLGANLEWAVSDTLSLEFDLSYSDAEDSSDEGGGGGRFAVIREGGNLRYDARGGFIPSISTDTGFGSDTNSLSTFVLGRFGEGVDDDITEVKASGVYEFENSALTEIRFGAQYSEEERFNTVVEQADGIGFYAFPGAARVTVPGNLVGLQNTSSFLSGADNVTTPSNIVSYDIDALLAFLGSDAALSQRDAGLGITTSAADFAARGGFDATIAQGQSFGVDEEIFALFLEAQFDGQIGTVPWVVNAGVRYVKTDTTSRGFQDTLTDIRAIAPGATSFLLDRIIGEEVSVSADYDNVLPSINARFNLTDDLVLRTAYSETLTRPVLTDLAPRIAFGPQVRPGNFVVNAGNPNLQPFESENLDLSLEWYYGEGSYLAGSAFRKDVSGFVVTQDFSENFTIANVDNITNEPAINGNTATFIVRRPENTTEATIDGFELSWQHTFGNGFGIIANATFVDSDAVLDASDPTADSNSALLPGLGDSRNLVLFYENDKFGARLAYNVRDEFLRAAATGPGSEPAFVQDYEQLDFRVSYNINDSLQVFLDGTNVLSEIITQRARFENQFLLAEETGARYSIGLRGDF